MQQEMNIPVLLKDPSVKIFYNQAAHEVSKKIMIENIDNFIDKS